MAAKALFAGTDGINSTTVRFDAQSSRLPAGSIVTWQFGDGSEANGQQVEHVYAEPGIYTATLRVSTPLGLSDSEAITVNAGVPLVSEIRPSNTTFSEGIIGVELHLRRGLLYRLQRAERLGDRWVDIDSVLGNGDTATFPLSLPNDSTSGFWRIVASPPG